MNDRSDRDLSLPVELASSTDASRDQRRDETTPARLLVVLGMHRSGTSVVTRGLQALGVALGDDLMKPVAGNNDKGFFEDMDFYRLNERLLSKSTSAWHKLAPLDANALGAGSFSAERREAAALLNKKLADHGLFAFKDPRTAVLMPFWRCVIDDLELDDRYIIVVRHPLEAAASLQSRDGLPLAKGVALWAKHVIEAVRGTDGRPRVFVRFDRVLQEPQAQLRRIADVLGLTTEKVDPASLDAYAQEFLAPDLRHHLIGRGELIRSGLAPAYVVELYDLLLGLAQQSDASIAPAQHAWDSIVARFNESAPLLALSDALDAALATASQRANQVEKQNADLSAAVERERVNAARADESRLAAESALAAKSGELEALHADLTRTRQDAATRAAQYAAELSETRDQAAADAAHLRAQLQDAAASAAQYATALSETRDQAAADAAHLRAQLQDAAASAAQYATALSETRDQAAADAAHLRAQLQDAAASAAQYAAALSDARAQAAADAAHLRAQVQDAAIAQSTAEANLAQLRDELAALRQTMADAIRDAEINVDLEARLREATELSANLEIQKLREAHETLQARNQEEVGTLRSSLTTATQERDHAHAELAALSSQLQHLRQSFADALRESALDLDLEARLRDAQQLNADLVARRLKEAVDALRGENADALARAHAKLEALERANEALRRDRLQAVAERDRAKGEAEKQRVAQADLVARGHKLQGKIDTLANEKRALRRDLLLTRGALTAAHQSLSWRVTKPLRAMIQVVRDPIGGSRAIASRLARAAWHRIPLSPEKRGQLAARMFSAVPVLFYWSNTYKAWRAGGRPEANASGDDAKEPSLDPALEGYTPLLATSAPANLSARAVAFYLPQFHPIPENDAWWGKGFTEWTKVRAAQPRFTGHYQPHEPDDILGHYDLVADRSVMRKQAELAKLHGIEAFCFYFYWFAGKRLLETPLLNLLEDRALDLPFCLCWANENWTRRWDGKDSEILIAQDHSDADDLAFIQHVSRYLADPRYIRVDGRPVLLVYRPMLLPEPRKTAQRWRKWLRDHGHGEIYLAYTQSFESPRPEDIGFDAAIEFPPNNMGLAPEPTLVGAQAPDAELAIYDWRRLVARSRLYPPAPYKLFRAVTPSWDNTARRPHGGTVLAHASPNGFHEWLSNAIADTMRRFANRDERIVFINAWNEWAEGAHLEPDKRYGFAWLEAARRALAPEAGRPKVLVVTHDLRPHGAQYIALNLARALRRQYGCEVATLTTEDGPLRSAFEAEGPLHIISQRDGRDVDTLLSKLASNGYQHALVNSAASAWISNALSAHNITHVGLVHELPHMIETRRLAGDLQTLNGNARAIVFPAAHVCDQDAAALGVQWRNALVQPQGLYKAGVIRDFASKEPARQQLACQLNLPSETRFVLGVGYADRRKGVDIFVEWATTAAKRWPALRFLWVGDVDPAFKTELERKLATARAQGAHVHMLPFVEDTAALYAAADLYALSSREDPFPSTALEALAAATPVVMVQGAGGIEELSAHGCVIATPPDAFVSSIAPWIDNPAQRQAAGVRGRALISEKFGSASYAGAIADALGLNRPNISVVVPNYNYAHHLEQRLTSIINQTLAPREIIFIDDASTDDSVAVAERILGASNINWRIVRNAENSGSVFAQWRKGTELAQGDLIWIAEADDWADPRFLEAASKPFARGDVVLSMTESRQVDGDGQLLAPNYLDYVRDVSPDKWTKPFIGGGAEEIRVSLAIKNTIPNASAVLFRRQALRDALTHAARELTHYRVAGDWCVYVNMLRHGALAFSPSALNHHRRHAASTTLQRFTPAELAELARMQAYVAREFGVSDADQARARAYLERLVAQFELEKRYSAAQIAGALRGVAAA